MGDPANVPSAWFQRRKRRRRRQPALKKASHLRILSNHYDFLFSEWAARLIWTYINNSNNDSDSDSEMVRMNLAVTFFVSCHVITTNYSSPILPENSHDVRQRCVLAVYMYDKHFELLIKFLFQEQERGDFCYVNEQFSMTTWQKCS